MKGTYKYAKRDDKGYYILVHDMKTSSGQSGSPIMRLVKEAERQYYEVVGIHTHKGTTDYTNEGLMMMAGMRRRILYFSKKLCELHKLDHEWYFIKTSEYPKKY